MKESNFVKLIRKHLTIYNWFRIETTTVLGFPDMIGIAPQMDTIFVETKVARSHRVSFSPHQFAMSKRLSELSDKSAYVLVYDELAKPSLGAREILYGAWDVGKLQKTTQDVPILAVGWPAIHDYWRKRHEKSAENREL